MKDEKKVNDDTQKENKKKKRSLILRIICAAVTLVVLVISIITFGLFTESSTSDVTSAALSLRLGKTSNNMMLF